MLLESMTTSIPVSVDIFSKWINSCMICTICLAHPEEMNSNNRGRSDTNTEVQGQRSISFPSYFVKMVM